MLIGLTLAVDQDFKVLFVVLVFHQTFEGLGLGARLAYLELPPRYHYVPVIAAIMYGMSTPIGIAVGLGVRASYNPGSTTASIVSGVMDSLSAGILIYTGLVEVRPILYSISVGERLTHERCSFWRTSSFSTRRSSTAQTASSRTRSARCSSVARSWPSLAVGHEESLD